MLGLGKEVPLSCQILLYWAVDSESTLMEVRREAINAKIWTHRPNKKNKDINHVWILHASEHMQVFSDIITNQRVTESEYQENVHLLAIGRLAPDENNGGHEGSTGSVDESLILSFEASYAFLQTIHRVFALLSSPSNLLRATQQRPSRAEFLSGSTNERDATVPTVHARLPDLLASNIDRPIYDPKRSAINESKYVSISQSDTHMLGGITMNGISNITRCPLFEVVSLSSSGKFLHHASIPFKCGYSIRNTHANGVTSIPTFVHGTDYRELPENEYKKGRTYYYAYYFFLTFVPVVAICLYFARRKYLRARHKREEELAKYKEAAAAKSSAWKIKARHIKLEKMLGEGAFGTVYKGSYNSTPVAIKRYKDTGSGGSDAEFITELLTLMDVRHTHLTQLIGAILGDDEITGHGSWRGVLL